MKFKKYFLFITLLMLVISHASAEVAIVVHPNAKIDALAENDVKRIFLGKMKNFPSGGNVTPVDQSENDFRGAFYEKVIGKNAAQLKSYWSTLIFSGKGTPPKEIGDGAAVKSWIASNPDAIGYIEASQTDSSVKVVAKF